MSGLGEQTFGVEEQVQKHQCSDYVSWCTPFRNSMPFLRLVKAAQEQGCVFGVDEIAAVTTAFDQIVDILQLTDGDDPVATMIAKFIVELVRNGEHDPNVLRRQALELFLEQF